MNSTIVSVVLPVFNEGDTIVPCLRRLHEALRGLDHELLICYDFDGDSTLPAIESMTDRPTTVRLVKNPSGRDVVSTIRAGFQAAKGDVVVVTLRNLSAPPEVIPAMARKIREEGADVVAASRTLQCGSPSGGPRLKAFLARVALLLWRGITGLGTNGATDHFRAFRKTFLETVTIESNQGFELALELTVKAQAGGYRVTEVPSSGTERNAGGSRIPLWKRMPALLRWYGVAMAGPLTAWMGGLLCFAGGGFGGGRPGFAVLQALLAVSLLLLARVVRGRSVGTDAFLAAAWLHGGFTPAAERGNLFTVALLSAGASALYLSGLRERPLLRPSPRGSAWGAAAFGATLWLWILSMPEAVTRGLDPSWKHALAYFHLHELQAGVDYVFTFGPLGCFYEPMFRHELFGAMVAWELAIKFLLALILVRLWRSIGHQGSRIAFIIVCFLVLPIHSDSLYLLAILAACLRLLHEPRRPLQDGIPELLILAAVSLVKFSFAAAALAGLFVILASLVAARQWRRAATSAGLFALLVVLFWSLCGQRLGNLPSYTSWSLRMALAYSDCAGIEPRPMVARFGVASLIAAAIVVVFAFVQRPQAPGRRWGLLLVSLVGYFAWKAGFTRADGAHLRTFFLFLPLALFMIPFSSGAPLNLRRLELLLRSAAAVPAGLFLFVFCDVVEPMPFSDYRLEMVEGTIRTLLRPQHVQREHRHVAEGFARMTPLPRIREAVGGAMVDVISADIDAVLMNGLRWKPRPGFQSYAVFLAALMEWNARALAAPDGPEFLLLRLGVIDSHLPSMEDSRSLMALARGFKPVLEEGGFQLYRRRSPTEALPPPRPGPVIERRVAWGEFVDLESLPGTTHVLSLKVEPTLNGRLARALLRLAGPQIEIECASGERSIHRWAPSLAEAGFVVDPSLRNEEKIRDWILGNSGDRARRFRLLLPEHHESQFASEVLVRIECFDGVP